MPSEIGALVWTSWTIAVPATALAAVGAVGAAVWVSGRAEGKRLWDVAFTLPLALPPTAVGFGLLVVLGRLGPLGWLWEGLGLRLVFTPAAAVVAGAVAAFPLVYRAARAGLEGVPADLREAARLYSPTRIQAFARVILPLAWKPIAAGTALGLARALGEFGATLMVAGSLPGRTRTFPMAVYEAVQAGRDREAMVLVAVATLTAAGLLVAADFALSGRQR
ncbi:MAG: ABC transporter permease subunit [Candidatus Dadabacteria bacterium]|nr:MAG: ABC transporter permease subunit [Candidatus Dadabacteria bacterium]